jgi:hypothetical protein
VALVYRNGRPRIQRSVRRGGRVTTEYRASGEVALLIAKIETIEHEEREIERGLSREERKWLDDLERTLDDLTDKALVLARDALERAGYHQHHRGEWRRRRESRACEG